MERINIYYIIAAVFVIAFVWGLMVPPIIRILEGQRTELLYRWLFLALVMPLMTLLLLFVTLTYVRSLYTEKDKEQVKELITPELSEKEIFEESIFENEKLRVLNILKTMKKLKGNKIPLSVIRKKTSFEIDDIEDIILILMADELLNGDLEYTDDGPIFIFPEKKEIKVKYVPDSKDAPDKNNEEE
ncbi:MAG: hypothetical protein ACTSRG_05910 [Candidatus Helarchaeota archaeon]